MIYNGGGFIRPPCTALAIKVSDKRRVRREWKATTQMEAQKQEASKSSALQQRMLNSWLVAGLLVCGSAAWMTTALASQRQFPDTSAGIAVFEDQLDSSMSAAQYKFSATHFAGTQKMLRDDARHLRQYNSNFLVLHYRLGQALGHSVPVNGQPSTNYLQIIDGNQWVQEWPGDSNVQNEWFFIYNNSRVFNTTFGHYLMELNDPSWRTWWSGQIIQQMQDNEDDGLFGDSYSIPNYFGPTWNPALPAIDSNFEQSWATREHTFTDYIRGQFAGQYKWIPNIGSYITTRDPSDYSNLDGCMFEGFAEGGSSNWYALGDWQLEMNRALPMSSSGKIILAQTYPDPTNVSERMFIVGSYLLIKGTQCYVCLRTTSGPEWYPEYDVNLGAPTDPLPTNISTFYKASWGVYVRHFAKGMVLVNPDSNPYTINNLGGTYVQVSPSGGGAVPANGIPSGSLAFNNVTSLTLNAHESAILLNVGSTNSAPHAVIVASPVTGLAPLSVNFDGSNSYDPDGSVASYSWNFGDASSAGSGATPAHTYMSGGTFTATLTVTDNSGASSTSAFQIVVVAAGVPPVITTSSPLVGGTAGTPYLQVFAATGGVFPLTWSVSAGSLPTGLTLSSSGVLSGTPASAGISSFTVSVTDSANKSASLAFSLTIAAQPASPPTGSPAPVVVSPPSVSPTSVVVGSPVTFSASAKDPNGGSVTYTWNFGDGSTATGSTATHTFASAGAFTVTLTLTTSSGGTTTATMLITASAEPSALPLSISKLRASLKFSTQGHDSCSISGSFPSLTASFNPTGQTLVLNISGASFTFTLNAHGQGKSSTGDRFTLRIKKPRKNAKTPPTSPAVTFSAGLQHGAWTAAWGINPSVNATRQSMSLPVDILLGGNTYSSTTVLSDTAKSNRGATIVLKL